MSCITSPLLNEVVHLDAGHGSAQVGGHFCQDLWVIVVGDRLDNSFSSLLGVFGLEDSASYKDSVHAQLHHQCGIRRSCNTACGKLYDWQTTKLLCLLYECEWCADFLCKRKQLVLVHVCDLSDFTIHRSGVSYCLNNVASSSFSLGSDEGRALIDTAQCLSQVSAAADVRHRKVVLVDVVHFVSRGQHFRLIDVVHANRFQDLGLHKVPDSGLGHNWDRNGVDDTLDHLRIRHSCYFTVLSDICWDPLQGHDSTGTSLLCNLRLFRRNDVHDNAALEHLRQADLHAPLLRPGLVLAISDGLAGLRKRRSLDVSRVSVHLHVSSQNTLHTPTSSPASPPQPS
mmetsp:Transcript_7600/g.23045  ORF Transcript_7600/g.23045 Transcript_7600/m.23045 type:complete len:342 (-) Transcript_7600:40-1065(-)